MKETSYPIVGSWRQALKGLEQARPSAMFSGVIGAALFWLVTGLFQRFSSPLFIRGGIPLPILATVAIVSRITAKTRSGSKRRHLALARFNVLVNMMYIVLFLLALSGYFLMGALGVATTGGGLPETYATFIAALYALSAIAAIIWSPRSLPRSQSDDEKAFARSAKWLPWLIGMQGSLVGIGVFLGVLAAQSPNSWSLIALAGLATLGAVLCVTFSILLFYRFAFLALKPVPQEVQKEFGLGA